jgi:class III poly(R)-hydroxyalkanoic acid synthase PhaE subunit
MAGFADTWSQAWLDMQQQYMDAWKKLSSGAMPGQAAGAPFSTTGSNLWANAFDQWSSLFGQAMPANARGVSTRLFELGKNYMDASENFWKLMQQGSMSTGDWQQALKDTFAQAGRGMGFPGGASDPWSGFAALWGLPLSNWQRMATSFSPFPGEMEKALRPGHIPQPGDMTHAVRHFLSLPSVGYTREWQEQFQEWGILALEYQRAVQNFSTLLGRVVQNAQELFGKRLADRLGQGDSFDDLRAIYNLWIDCGEEAYAGQVASAEFPHLQAEMINALMRMKHHEQGMVEEIMTGLNMPTRQEVDTSHRRVYELQRQLSRLQDALENGNGPAAATTTRASAQPAAPARKKTATRRKTGTTAKRGGSSRTRKG